MKELVGSRLPSFSADEKALLRANLPDFFFLNHYTSRFAYNDSKGQCGDSQVCDSIVDSQGVQIGPQAESPWLSAHIAHIIASHLTVWHCSARTAVPDFL